MTDNLNPFFSLIIMKNLYIDSSNQPLGYVVVIDGIFLTPIISNKSNALIFTLYP